MATTRLSERELRSTARRAYERGRLCGALARGAGALVLALPGYFACGRTPLATACLGSFALVVAIGRLRGEEYERGVRAGVLAGLLPCLLPSMLRVVNRDLCELLFTQGPWLCALGGVAAGAILGWRSRAAVGIPFWISALVTLALAVTLGCLPAGAMGFMGLLAGMVAGGAPVLTARRASP